MNFTPSFGRLFDLRHFDSSRQVMRDPIRCSLAGLLAVIGLVGCESLRTQRLPTPENTSAVIANPPVYRVGCPDVLLLTFTVRPDWDSLTSVDVDGTLPLPESLGRLRVQGLTLEEIRDLVAQAGNVKPETVAISLEDARSSRIYITGPVNATTRTIPFRGPEPVLDFLVRIGAIQKGCTNLNRVYVVRPNISAGEKADVFHVDVDAVALDGEQKTNIVIQPNDHIYVGETHRSSFSRLLPAWLRPFYRSLVGLMPPDPQWWWAEK